MIIRAFRARVRPGMQDAFERMVREHSIPLAGYRRDCLPATISFPWSPSALPGSG
jgi:hypothetical protein